MWMREETGGGGYYGEECAATDYGFKPRKKKCRSRFNLEGIA